ncbi:MAG: hypothetical protein ACI9RZ_001411, partial [Sphingobacteriales bacterium]
KLDKKVVRYAKIIALNLIIIRIKAFKIDSGSYTYLRCRVCNAYF